MLSQSQKDAYQEQGYLVLDRLFSPQEMNTLRRSALEIVDNFNPDSTRSIFSTDNADTNRDDYFLDSGDKVRCFFEEEAFSATGELQQDKSLSINKIGHALHKLCPEFKSFSHSKVIADIARDLGVSSPEIRQSMYIFKQPKIGGAIRWHQDATYFYTTPLSVVTFWLAIEDATVENGCLHVDREGAEYPLREQFKRYANNNTQLEQISEIDWPSDDHAMALEVKAGSLVVFNGVLPHFSNANRSNKSRHAFTLHITSAEAHYDELNWLQAVPSPI